MEKHTTYFNFLDALKEKGCSLCFLIKKTSAKFMDDLLYEKVNDTGLRKDLRESSGFCARHAWQLQNLGDGFALGIIYEDLLEGISSNLEKDIKNKKISSAGRWMPAQKSDLKRGHKECPVCQTEKAVEERYISILKDFFDDAEFSKAFHDSFGLCLPHVAAVAESDPQKEMLKALIDMEEKKIQQLVNELKEFKKKHDYRFSGKGFGKESDSWIRAVEKMTGKEGVF